KNRILINLPRSAMTNNAVWPVPLKHLYVSSMRLNTHSFPPTLFKGEGVAEAPAVYATHLYKKTILLILEDQVEQRVFPMLTIVVSHRIFRVYRCQSDSIRMSPRFAESCCWLFWLFTEISLTSKVIARTTWSRATL